MSKICMSCGAMNRNDTAVCARCGKVLKKSFNSGGYQKEEKTETIFGNENNYLGSLRDTYLSDYKNTKKLKMLGIAGAIAVVAILVIMYIRPASIVGTWKMKEAVVDDGYQYTETITFNEDHTGVATAERTNIQDSDTYSESAPLEWTRSEGSKYLVTIENKNFLIEIKGRKFSLERERNKELVYVKQYLARN